MEFPSGNDFLDGETGRRTFARMLWAAFPSRSENELAEKASIVLGVTDRQVRNWLRGVHDAKASHVMALIVLIGFEKAMSLLGRGVR